MNNERYRIVFRGEIGMGYELAEIRENLCRLTRWSEEKVDQLLQNDACIIKNDLDASTADHMLQALNNTGIICKRELIPSAAPTTFAPEPLTVKPVESLDDNCPKCGARRDGSATCASCHVVFSKVVTARTVSAPPQSSTPPPPLPVKCLVRRREDPLAIYDRKHPVRFYLEKLLLVIAGALVVRYLFHSELTLIIALILPLGFILYIGVLSAVTDRTTAELLHEHRALLPIVYTDRERGDKRIPYATYGLILSCVIVHYAFQLRSDPELLANAWYFLPRETTLWNILLSAVASLFFHADGFALWGSMFFLWLTGSTLEPRIGYGRFLALYLLSGLIAAGAGLGVQQLLAVDPLQMIGAGGAIAGLFGIFAVGFHSRIMVPTIPLVDLWTCYRLRWSSLLTIGLFVLSDLSRPLATETEPSGIIGPCILLFGFITGLTSAQLLAISNEAEAEDTLATPGMHAFAPKPATLRRRLEKTPDNPDLLVQLARTLYAEGQNNEARALYRRAIILCLSRRPNEAAAIYREFTSHDGEAFEPKLMMRLANYYLRQGDEEIAAYALRGVSDDPRATLTEREQALFQFATTLAKLGQIEEAQIMQKRFSNEFPDSPHLQRLQNIVHSAAFAGSDA